MMTFGSWLADDSLRSVPDDRLHLKVSLSPVLQRGRADWGGVASWPCFIDDPDDGNDDTATWSRPAWSVDTAGGQLARRPADGCGDRARRSRSAAANRLSSCDIRPAWGRWVCRRDLRWRDEPVLANIMWYSCSAVGPDVLGVLGGGRADVGVTQALVGVVAGVSSSSSSPYGTVSESIAASEPCWLPLPPLPPTLLSWTSAGPVTVVVGRPWSVSRWRATVWCSGLPRCDRRGDDGLPPTLYKV